jgi:hypothetical protein
MYAINVYSFEIKYVFFGKFFFILNYFDLLIGKINFKKYIVLKYILKRKRNFSYPCNYQIRVKIEK